MVYVIGSACVGVKSHDCVDVCPVDCIHPKKGDPKFSEAPQLYINPVECISCGHCEAVCPVEAITHEKKASPEDIKNNEDYFKER